jgi:hypothetical protein
MTGTYAACLPTNQSRSYLNHLVFEVHSYAVSIIMPFTTCISLDHTISDHKYTHRKSWRTGNVAVRSVVLPIQAINAHRKVEV